MNLPFNYIDALYRKNNHGQPCVWIAVKTGLKTYTVYHGILGKTISSTLITTHRLAQDEIKSKFNAKQKEGYKYLSELKDNVSLPVEGELLSYLNTYLTEYRTNAEGYVLAMKAKCFDNENNKLFKNVSSYYGQWKINGLRCFISAYEEEGLFGGIKLQFQSREGIIWKSLKNLETYLLSIIPDYFLNKMLDEHYILDGELYLPGYTVNEINHFVKDPNCPQNVQLQFWCYDLAIADYFAAERKAILFKGLGSHRYNFTSKEDHLNNREKLVILPSFAINNEDSAIINRNKFIDLGFEGLIMRDPNEEYQFGKRNSAMIKFKKSTDGKFQIIDIKPEGVKRPDIPLFVCKNDINEAEFECHCGGSLDYQRSILREKDKYIGKYMHVEFGERSGCSQVPFHIKTTYIIN